MPEDDARSMLQQIEERITLESYVDAPFGQEFLIIDAGWPIAVICPAHRCGADGRWP
jgi:hypothetical protein